MGDWLRTTWYGGNSVQPEPRARVLAVSEMTSTFHHEARVRRTPDGIEAEWLDESTKPPTWRPFIGSAGSCWPDAPGRIPKALMEQAEEEERGRAGGGARG